MIVHRKRSTSSDEGRDRLFRFYMMITGAHVEAEIEKEQGERWLSRY